MLTEDYPWLHPNQSLLVSEDDARLRSKTPTW